MSASFKFSTAAATQPGPLMLHSEPYKEATGGKIFPHWEPPLDTGGTNIFFYSIFARSSARPWFLAAKVPSGLEPLYAPVSALNASTAYEIFVLAESSVASISIPGKLSIAEGSRVLRTSVDLSSWLSMGTVLMIQVSAQIGQFDEFVTGC
ncbi:unnamed protein product [Phytophthora lilii]|uniref:Unnamed protein product n=1 Tax=Phytophthora lilii TaxID=2077276 RepID=A0A9W6TWS4_9STRA|nr:unnamed protein product [Phytophthora lilii]